MIELDNWSIYINYGYYT